LPAPPDVFGTLRSADEWKNPFLIIGAQDCELLSAAPTMASAASVERVGVSVEDLREALLKLPVSAWPLGRVVAVSEVGMRSEEDDPKIRRNLQAVQDVLKGLGIMISRWPS
jgi:hypothetical protein